MFKAMGSAVCILSLFAVSVSAAAETIDDLHKKCDDEGSMQACFDLAKQYVSEDQKYDFNKASKYYGKACDFGRIKEACDALVFKRGATSRIKSYRIPKDVVRASKIYNYAVKTTNYETLYELFKQYCEEDGDFRACAYYGEMKVLGLGTNRTVNRGISLIRESCSEGDVYACSNLGYRYFAGDEIDTDDFKAFNLLNYACSNGEFGACRYVAAFYENEIGVNYDKDKIIYLYSKACDNAEAVSCQKLGAIYLESSDVEEQKKAVNAFNTGCEYGSVRSCTALGDIYKVGTLVKSDPKTMFSLYKQACDGNDPNACVSLADCYAEGIGVKKSRNGAAAFYSKACDLGAEKACEKSRGGAGSK